MIPIAAIAAAAPAMIGLGKSIFGKSSDQKQYEQQEKLTNLQAEKNKELAKFNKDLSMQMWNETGYEGQRKQMEDAGLNPALMYGMSGGGGQTANAGGGAGMVSGGSADGAAARTGNDISMAMLGAQLEVMKSQANKNNAEAAATAGVNTDVGKQNIEASKTAAAEAAERTRALKFQNEVNQAIGVTSIKRSYEWALDKTIAESAKAVAEWDAYKAAGFINGNTKDPNSPVAKAYKAGFEKTIVDVENAKKEGKVKEAEIAVKNLEAELSKMGIPQGSPWGIKIIGELLKKVGLMD